MKKTSTYYTKPQIDFINHSLDRQQHARVIAGPGSGKTTTLLARVRYLLESGIPANRILILAFNRSIKNQFENKLSSILFVENHHYEIPTVKTFHAWGRSLTYDLFNVRPDNSLILSHKPVDATSLSILFKGLFSGGSFRDRGVRVVQKNRDILITGHKIVEEIAGLEEEIKELKQERHNIHELIEHCVYIMSTYRNMIGNVEDMHEKKPAEVDSMVWDKLVRFVAQVDTFLVAQGVTLFEDQLYRAAMFLTRSSRGIEYLQNKYDYILVDEFQDVSEVSQFLVVSACKKHCQLNAVGDPRQSIFEFAGADPAYLTHGIDEALGSISTYYLSESFRFGANIAHFANKIGRGLIGDKVQTEDAYDEFDLYDRSDSYNELASDYGNSDSAQSDIIGLKAHDSAYIEHNADVLIEKTSAWLRTNKSVVYIVRTHDQKVDVEAFLVKAKLHFKHNASTSYKTLACVVESLLYILDCWTIDGVLSNRPSFWKYSEGPVTNPAALVYGSDNIPLQFEGFVRSFLLIEKLKAISPSLTILAIYERIYEEVIKECMDFLMSCEKPYNKEALARGMARKYIETIYTRYEDQLSEIHSAENYVHVEVAHRVKGLEFDKVVVFDFTERVFPYARQRSELDESGIPFILSNKKYIAEEQRLAFVAATRAKEELIFYVPQNKLISRFITD